MHRFEEQFEAPVADAQIEETLNKLDIIGDMARKCLASNDFQNYQRLFNDELNNIMNAMVIYTANFGKKGNENLEIYAVNMIRFVQRITDLRKLITYIETDARKGLKQGDADVKY